MFRENCCRLCAKSFCCAQCRFSHEENFHKVNPECEICLYGRTTVKDVSFSLLTHIKNTHWPLHCVFCKKVFLTLDELLPHEKCSARINAIKMQGTPKTPISEKDDDESPVVTPFYKCVNSAVHLNGATLAVTAVTSTPLFTKDDKSDRITPINQIQISSVQKSNLKLTGSSNFSDSKKSDRRVTFSETPSVAEPLKKPKYLPMPMTPLNKYNENTPKESTDSDSYDSAEEEFKTAPITFEDKENCEKEIYNAYNATLWESALTKFDVSKCEADSKSDSMINNTNLLNVSVQINVFNSPVKSDNGMNKIVKTEESFNTTNLWSSMTNIVKSVVNNISMTAQNSFTRNSVKRSQPEPDDGEITDVQNFKRMKLTDLKCRRTIRDIGPLYNVRLSKTRCVDKATQTEESYLYDLYKNKVSL